MKYKIYSKCGEKLKVITCKSYGIIESKECYNAHEEYFKEYNVSWVVDIKEPLEK